eukprot:CAMPEP_0117421610 /NCGR_PEP_ID=MMETSP0758-20121206/2648_1 /TAXON_ID=63605 /ORGANISM="Percolomonas cosmopolitus, Strain AE-1 (ATCC 50343)" /LENGTH=108 /DNA_ID=CAMNT_0005203799 /DNA_START=340 /DNA_END=666 /DNA_ORIENTATION=-
MVFSFFIAIVVISGFLLWRTYMSEGPPEEFDESKDIQKYCKETDAIVRNIFEIMRVNLTYQQPSKWQQFHKDTLEKLKNLETDKLKELYQRIDDETKALEAIEEKEFK